ncbi:alpha-amylase family glycosyl hydrolase [Flavobacterium selenitireducens]|uniref:alpha-amylase family glycosyl hydrolase n=1 Tax=Flavobacterium selenitireducens TaxID=2722704 RepID=UPI00168B6F7D|nr:alpha-amylase family glycosyl hydrolase [Flavobacterium selenitireducens]MBD3583122.1 T9SS type A sorting domain-containing protein [Flavobacterium selenitireducens]
MKHFYLGLLLVFGSLFSSAQVTTTPAAFEATQAVTINFNKTGTPFATYTGTIYAHIGVTVNGQVWQNVKGSWGNNTTQPALTNVGGNNYQLAITPNLYTYFGVPTTSTISAICLVLRGATGTPQTSPDIIIPVGEFQLTLSSPGVNSTTLLNSGGSLTISASNTGGAASYELLANGASINTFSGSGYSFTDTNITVNKFYELRVSQGQTTHTRKFSVMVNPGTVTAAMPSGLEDGINYNPSDATKATLVLTAPGKDFVYVAGSFNGYQPTPAYAMKKDATANKFWLELTGLTSGQTETYQYWVVDQTPTANSPALVKTADPFSTLVYSPFDDGDIPAASYPGLPDGFPEGVQTEITVLKTGQTSYNWQVNNFVKPAKEDLVVYEVLIRDFDGARNFQSLINRIQYFKDLKVNAIQLMPVMEYEGNESWGYNTSFHMALDKYYGTADKLKEFVDLCHQNGIAVILDVALNHAFGRNPMVRMWMKDADGNGFGDPASDNPYFNEFATHAYNVGSDFNHQSALTKYYTKRVIKHWIKEFHIDGFRWDLTKGFTQNCLNNNGNCTDSYQQDRVDVLKDYVNYSWDGDVAGTPNMWSGDPTHYAIFEHLGPDNEEQQWANHRIGETPSKGVMMWGNVTGPYGQLSMGFNSNNDIARMGHTAHNFSGKRVIGYAESHDEERLMYKNLAYGNNSTPAHNVRNLSVALSRMSAIGAISLLVPGPKMIWHFGELGMDLSIFTCTDGTVNLPDSGAAGDCKLATKPQPQWTGNYPTAPGRSQILADWTKMIQLKTTQPVFRASYDLNSGTTLTPRLYVYDNTMPATQLKNVVILTNFNVTSQAVVANFPYAGIWYNLMDNTQVNVTNPNMSLTLAPGQFRIYGNQLPNLVTDEFDTLEHVSLYPNPTRWQFSINANVSKVDVFSLTGQLVKRFQGDFTDASSFDITELNSGIYIVKVTDVNSREKAMKLVKE